MWWPADHPALTDEPIAAGRLAAEEILPGGQVGAVLRHVPGRRVATLVTTERGAALLKLYARPRARGAHRRLAALAAAGLGEIVPESWGVSTDGRAGVVGWADGETWHDLPDRAWIATARRVGVALRRLHGSTADLGRTWTAADETSQLLNTCPGRVAHVVARATLIAPLRERLVPAHRDLHTKQVIVSLAPDAYPSRVRFIDLDDAAMAPAGLDVGNLLAHLRVEAVRGARSAAVVEKAQRSFEVGYGPLPASHRRWQALTLVRLTGIAATRGADEQEIHSLLVFATKELDAIGAPLAPPAPVDVEGTKAAFVATLERRGSPVTSPVLDLNPRHPDRPVLLAHAAGGDVVAKSVNRDSRAALGLLVALWRGELGARAGVPGVPEPLGVAGPLVMMSALEGEPMARRGTMPEQREEEVAQLLAGLHASAAPNLKTRDAAGILRSVHRKVSELPDDRAAWFWPVVAAMTAASAAADSAPLLTGHGDFAPRNVLAAPTGLSLVDFDRVTLCPADRDIAYWGAWCWTTALTLGQEPDWGAGDRLLEAYRGIADEHKAGGAVGFHRAAALVRIAHGWSALQGDESSPDVRAIGVEALYWAKHAAGH